MSASKKLDVDDLNMIKMVLEACKTIGFPAAMLIGIGFIFYTIADRYLDHTIDMESELQKHRIATEKIQQEMLTQSFTVFVDIHKQQTEAIIDIRDFIQGSELSRMK